MRRGWSNTNGRTSTRSRSSSSPRRPGRPRSSARPTCCGWPPGTPTTRCALGCCAVAANRGNPIGETMVARSGYSRTVCHLLHALHVGGAEVLAARLARRLGHAFRFVFVCLDELGTLGQELRREGHTVHVLGRRAGL